jgi:hypothetical protein
MSQDTLEALARSYREEHARHGETGSREHRRGKRMDSFLRSVEPEPQQTGIEFSKPLADKYMPKRVADFVGMPEVVQVLAEFVRKPYSSSWIFHGPSGTGKTAMGLAMVNDVPAELRHVASRACNLEEVADIAIHCRHYPWMGLPFHLVLTDEANEMTSAAQDAFLSKLDGSERPPDTIFVFTTNSLDRLAPRFLSRCRVLPFTAPSIEEMAAGLDHIWATEGGGSPPDFKRIAFLSKGDFRAAITKVELALLGMQSSTSITLDQRAQRIRDLVRVARKAIIEIGNELIAAKGEMPHGAWLPWLQSNFGWSDSSAQNYMNVARAFGKFPTVGDLTGVAIEGRALYYLASKNVPDEVRAEAVEMAKTRPIALADAKNLHADKSERPNPMATSAARPDRDEPVLLTVLELLNQFMVTPEDVKRELATLDADDIYDLREYLAAVMRTIDEFAQQASDETQAATASRSGAGC